MITKKQLKKIEELIKRRFLGFTLEALGEKVLSPEELKILSDAGITRTTVRHLTADPYAMGKLVALVERPTSTSLTYAEIERAVTSGAMKMTGVEEQAIQYASDHAGEYIKGIMSDTLKDVKTSSARAGWSSLRQVQENVTGAIAERQTISELKTTLFGSIDNRVRDWQRVAHTEMNNAVQNGIYQKVKETSDEGENQLVFKRPAPDACKHCNRLYLKEDGVTPRVFKMSELADSNIGLKAANWQATVGGVHPWCFDEETEVLTESGWLLFKNVGEERILSVNLANGQSEWTDIKEKIAYHHKGKMNKYKSKICDLVVTQDHKSVIKTEKNQGWRLIHEKELPNRYSMLGTIPDWIGCTCSQVIIGDSSYPINLFCEFMGYFLSEGSIVNKRDRNGWQISISQTKEKEKNIMFDCCYELFGKRVWRGSSAITISTNDSKLYDFLNLGKSYEKSIPHVIKGQSKERLKVFLDAFLMGDGHSRIPKWEGKEGNFREERVYYTSSKTMMSDLCEIILKIGKRPSVTDPVFSDEPKKFKNGDYVIKHPCYKISENWTTNVAVGHNMEREVIDYDGMVYDVELVRNNTLFVKRNGKVLLSGNCQCQLVPVPDGFEFEKKEVEYEGKIKMVAVLTHTGETARHDGV